MLEYLNKKIKLDIIITIIATFVSVNFIIFSYIFEEHAPKILSILIILLPTIYIIGNLIVRGIFEKEAQDMREGYDEAYTEISEGIEEMNQEMDRLRGENRRLKDNLR